MRRLMAIALVAAGVALPVCAQRGGGSRGGFSGHSAPAFHGGSAPSTHFSYASRPLASGSRFVGAAPAYQGGVGRLRPIRPLPVRGPGRFYGAGVPYGYGYGGGWVAPYYLGYPDSDSYDPGPAEPSNVPDDGSQSYVTLPPDQGPAPTPDGYQAYAQPVPYAQPTPTPQPEPEPEDAVTLIFKDGRAPEQIHNYMLTRTMLYVRDQHKRDIPVADLDLAATAKANRNSGVEFQIPGGQ